MAGSQLAQELADTVLLDATFIEKAIVLQETEGIFNQYGEFLSGALIETSLVLVSAPLVRNEAGQYRMALEEGLRDESNRTFWIKGDFVPLRYGATDGDQFMLGELGRRANIFNGLTLTDAERARDVYGLDNVAWRASYVADPDMLIKLTGFGAPLYQYYERIEGHWANAPLYRAMSADRWGSFTEVRGIRRNPGNLNTQ